MSRVFVFGIDGMPPQWMLERWMPELPHFRALSERGMYGRIQSTVPPTSIAAWTSIFSGCDPGQHGITGYLRRPHPPDIKMELVDSRDVVVPRVWDLLSEQGKRSIVLNVPMTYPIHPFNGHMVTDFLTPGFDSACVHPAERKDEIRDVLGGPYHFDVSEFGGYRRLETGDLIKRVFAQADEQLKWAEHALNDPWDLFVFATIGSDRLHHTIWRYFDPSHPAYEYHPEYSTAVFRLYQKLDAALGRILDRLPSDTTIIVTSDHGMGTMYGRVNLNDWLIQNGYLVLKGEMPTSPRKLDYALVDWNKTRAWATGAYEALLYVYPEKSQAADYDTLLSELSEKIRAIPGQHGVINTQVHRMDRLFGDAALAHAPDAVVYFDELRLGVNCDVGNVGLHSMANSVGKDDALHTPEGTFIMAGPNISARGLVDPISVVDITPTILGVLGHAPTSQMRGRNILL